MRVALDAGPLALTSGGLQRYVWELTHALARAFPSDALLLTSDQPFAMPGFAQAGPRNWLEKRWWLWGADRVCARERIDVFHGTNFAVPYRAGRATVLTLHDLSPWMDAAWHHSAVRRVRHRSPRMIKYHATIDNTTTHAVPKQA